MGGFPNVTLYLVMFFKIIITASVMHTLLPLHIQSVCLSNLITSFEMR
jgi:hypothetical protein